MIQSPTPGSLLLMALHVFRKSCACCRPAFALCDWKEQAHKSGTCDEPVCAAHAKEVLPGKFLCQRHWLVWEQLKRERKTFELKQMFSEAA